MSKCPRCNCEANGQNRLVTDSCGHSKCRLCLLADVSDCFECKLATQSEPSKNKDPPKQQEDNVQASDTRDTSTVNHITTTPDGFHCTVCNKTFRSRTQQYYHRACGNELLKKFPCTQCSRRFATRSHLKYHLNSHGSNSSYSCNVCGKTFQQELVLRHHKQRVHQNVGTFSCPHCRKKFVTETALKTHEIVHSGGSLPYKCDSCAKCYLTKANLKQHQLKHNQNSIRHSCSTCGKSFLRRSILRLHEKRHLSLRHNCSHCQKSLNDADALARHIKQHMTTQRYRCMQCDVTVNRRDNMIRHLRSMHQGVDFASGVEIIENLEPELVYRAETESTSQTVRYNTVIKSVGNVEPVILPTSKTETEQELPAVVPHSNSALPDKMQKENVKLYRKIILDLDNEEYSNELSSGLDLDLEVTETSDVNQATSQQPQMRFPSSSNFSERHWRKNFKNFYENEHLTISLEHRTTCSIPRNPSN